MTTKEPSNQNAVADALHLQRTLYQSRNPARRWLHLSRMQWIMENALTYGASVKGPVVDAGAGCGALLTRLCERFQTVIGIDREPAFLKDAGRISSPGSGHGLLTAGDLRSLPFKDDFAGLLICSEVLEHIKETQACLDEIFRVLAPGGIFILSTPQPFSLVEVACRIAFSPVLLPLARRIYQEPLHPTGHINLMSMKTIKQKLTRTGFIIVKIHQSGFYLPGFSDISSIHISTITRRLNVALARTPLAPLLWTQFFVARKPGPSESSRQSEKLLLP
ncbi:MAG: class I SAM-dependent methyltransferase [Thermodesulfobacteriota bacterium]|nr:class I SAM-dependent methyltransferase [Thermodesulfobacteriota bacterium]